MAIVNKKCYFCNVKSSYEYEDEPKVCPSCSRLYWNKPPIEVKLHTLQDEYLLIEDPMSRNRKIYGQMFELMYELAYNSICGKLKSSGKHIDEEDILDMAQDTMVKMALYYNRPSFRIDNSFTEYIGQVILYPLYNGPKKEREHNEISYNTIISGGHDGGNDTELIDLLSETEIIEDLEFYHTDLLKEATIQSLNALIDRIILRTLEHKGYSFSIKLLCMIQHFFNGKTDRFFNHYWKVNPFETRYIFEKTILTLKEYLKKGDDTMKLEDFDSIWDERLNKIFVREDKDELDKIFKIIDIYFYGKYNDDLSRLYSIVGLENFLKIINLFSCRQISFPDRADLRDVILTALSYYYRNHKDMSWDEIKDLLNFPDFSTIKYGKSLKKIEEILNKELEDVFSNA
jgi:DNA-directed RNA polymerase specialized sigma24 family protein